MTRKLRRAGLGLLQRLPETRRGDRLFSTAFFLEAHRRLPKRDSGLFSDFIFYEKLRAGDAALRRTISDKYEVKQFIAERAGMRYVVPTLALIDDRAMVREYDFPTRCCIKPTHASGAVILRTAGEPVDSGQIERWFEMDYYRAGRERNYKGLEPRVIVEPLVFDRVDNEDLKFFCRNGEVRAVQVDFDRRTDHRRRFYDRDWNEQDWSMGFPRAARGMERPDNLEEMVAVAETLSAGFPFLRVDFYSDGRDILCGELTNWPENATGRFFPRSAERSASAILLD